MAMNLNSFYLQLWDNEGLHNERRFFKEEKNQTLFKQRLKEDNENVQNNENPKIKRIVIIKQTPLYLKTKIYLKRKSQKRGIFFFFLKKSVYLLHLYIWINKLSLY